MAAQRQSRYERPSPSERGPHVPPLPAVHRAAHPPVRHPGRSRRDGQALRAQRRGPGARPDQAAHRQPTGVRRPALPPAASGPRPGPGERPPASDDRLRRSPARYRPAAFADYALRDQTRREHAVELQKLLRLRSFRLADWRACLQVGTDAAWATDRGEPIVRGDARPSARCQRAHPCRDGAGADRAGSTRARPQAGVPGLGGRPDRDRARCARSTARGRSGAAPLPLRLAAGLPGVAGALQHGRAARPARLRARPRDRRRARRAHPCRPPRPPGRGRRHHDRTAHRRPRTGAADRDPRGPGRRPGDPARGRDARHVREVHGLPVHQGPEPGRAALPGHQARRGEGAAAVPPHHRGAQAGPGDRRGRRRRRRSRGRHEAPRRRPAHHRVRRRGRRPGDPRHRGRALHRPAPVQPALPRGVPLPVEHAARPCRWPPSSSSRQ